MSPVAQALLAVAVVSLISLVGVVTLAVGPRKVETIALYLVAFAVGALLGDAFIHLLPEAFERLGPDKRVGLLAIGGVLLFFLTERVLRARESVHRSHLRPYVFINLVGDGVHNFFDGALIAASFLVSKKLGYATTLAVILHEIPQELGDFGVLVRGGLSVGKALGWNLLSALTAELGAVCGLLAGEKIQSASVLLLPVTAGGFVYLAGTDLIPELLEHQTESRVVMIAHVVLIAAGVAVMAALR